VTGIDQTQLIVGVDVEVKEGCVRMFVEPMATAAGRASMNARMRLNKLLEVPLTHV